MTPITEVEGRRVTLSNLDKVLYPATGTTKGEVLHYYAATVGSVILPHLADRPVSFLRYPDGPDGQLFFTKNPPPGTPAWVETTPVPRTRGPGCPAGGRGRPGLVDVGGEPGGGVPHAAVAHRRRRGSPTGWSSTWTPGSPATVVECCAVALWLRERLAADGLTAYGKTSGSKGLHLLVPLEPTPSGEVSAYAKRLALEAEEALPALALHRMKRSLRPGKVFVDFSQNSASKTTATPYTLRARPEPTVSAPVTWDEIADCREAGALVFRAGDMAARLDRHGDLLAPLNDPGQGRPLPRTAESS
ncbi:bifunctional non-homologous end joining protein LigD [Streptomyces sp. Ncost-T6T-2b]|nr:bifunctional non-homologous end joining protein LigD [Streptomyces sp. Ncost-T6T-2b]